MPILIDEYKVKENWGVSRENGHSPWRAWIKDPTDPETGTPLLSDMRFETLCEKIQAYELGVQHASNKS